MSRHSYTKVWLHIIWGTLRREKVLISRDIRREISSYLYRYAKNKAIYMKINYMNADHVHALVDLPTNISLEDMLQLLKGSSSHWINQNKFISGKFSWGRGYAIFAVSHSNIGKVENYIANQYEHHRRRTFLEEYQRLISSHNLVYYKSDKSPTKIFRDGRNKELRV